MKQVAFFVAMTILAFSCALPIWAQSNTDPLAKVVAPFVDDETILVARLDLTRINVADTLKFALPIAAPDVSLEDVAEKAKVVQKSIDGLRQAGASAVYFIGSLEDANECRFPDCNR